MKTIASLVLLLLIVGTILTNLTNLTGQTPATVKTALVIVDIQEFYFPSDGSGPVGALEASLAARNVLKAFRDEGLPVVHVKHNAMRGAEIHTNVAPLPGEKVITKEAINSFLGTDLYDYLRYGGVNRLVIIGMQTHMCVEATVRAAHDLGYDCIVVADACASRDLQFGDINISAEKVHASTLTTFMAGRYARVVTLEEFLAETSLYLYNP
ncbi:MAG: cysteine hydrolase family protein [Bacteroidales bacterium]